MNYDSIKTREKLLDRVREVFGGLSDAEIALVLEMLNSGRTLEEIFSAIASWRQDVTYVPTRPRG